MTIGGGPSQSSGRSQPAGTEHRARKRQQRQVLPGRRLVNGSRIIQPLRRNGKLLAPKERVRGRRNEHAPSRSVECKSAQDKPDDRGTSGWAATTIRATIAEAQADGSGWVHRLLSSVSPAVVSRGWIAGVNGPGNIVRGFARRGAE